MKAPSAAPFQFPPCPVRLWGGCTPGCGGMHGSDSCRTEPRTLVRQTTLTVSARIHQEA